MVALFLFMAIMAMLSAESAVAFTTPCPSRLSLSLRVRVPHSSPCPRPRELMLRGIPSVHLKLWASSPASQSNHDHDKDDFQQQRDAILGTAMFQKTDRVIVEALVQSMERLPVQKEQHLIQQGQASDGSMYIVASGTFECVDEVTGKVKQVLKTSELFGELAPEFGTERALTVKASSDDATVWRIPYRDFLDGIKPKTDAFDASLVAAIEKNPEYASYFAMKQRTDVFRKHPFFKPLQARDFNEVVKNAELHPLVKGKVLFKQGDVGDTMYVVKEGSIDIISEKSKQILKTCKKGDSFGELEMFFFLESNQRQASAVAAENCQLWEIKKDVLFSAAQESDLSEQALSAYREVYKDKRFSFEEFWEYLKIKSRPKKKPVSFHSTFSIFSTGMAVAALVPLFKPGYGWCGFQFFDTVHNLSDSTVQLLQKVGWMLSASGLMGIARLSSNTPASRRFQFISSAWGILLHTALLSSNFNYHPTAWWYNGLKFPGNMFLIGIGIAGQLSLLQMMDDAIVGSNKGREANTLQTTRVSSFLLTLVFFLGLFIVNITYAPFITGLTTEPALFKEAVLEFDKNEMNGLLVLPLIAILCWHHSEHSSIPSSLRKRSVPRLVLRLD